ncbi:MAG: DUF554 domain-containing protein [Anaerolineae bacterium]|nr:DUF554 domain-containing protein [Anaerolineae bacterium]
MMSGTWINAAAILVAGLLGSYLGSRLPEKLRETLVMALGIFTLLLGVQMFLKSNNTLIVLGSVFVGVIIGECLRIEDGLNNLGLWLESRFAGQKSGNQEGKFLKGFLTASLVFCIGPVAILGALQEGLTGKIDLLLVKSALDALGALAFASSLGLGVLFSAVPVVIYQGAFTLLASQLQPIMSDAMIAEMTATGGLLLVAIAISSFLEIRKIRVANILPALILAPAIVFVLQILGLS